jgi:uncharacterized protein YkwD
VRPVRRVAVCMLALAALALPAPAQASHATGLMIGKVNQVRARHGLPPLRSSPSLKRSSRRFSNFLMARDVFGHRSRVSASRRFRRLGEALALHGGHRLGVSGTVRSWLRSPTHRAIVLTRTRNLVGAGCTRGRFGGGRATIWVLQVGRL